MSSHILAMGGGSILSADSLLEGYLLELSGKRRPRVGFLPAAWVAAQEVVGTELREVVSQREGARGYRVGVDGETPIGPRRL